MLKGILGLYLRIYVFASSYACTSRPGPEARGPGTRGGSAPSRRLEDRSWRARLPGIGLQGVSSDGIALGKGGPAGFALPEGAPAGNRPRGSIR